MSIEKIQVYCSGCGYPVSVGDIDKSDVLNKFQTICPGCHGEGGENITWLPRRLPMSERYFALPQGKSAIVDEEDFNYLSQWKWNLYKDEAGWSR